MKYRKEIRYNPDTMLFDVLINGCVIGDAGNYADGDTLLGLELQRMRRARAVTRANSYEDVYMAGLGRIAYLTGPLDNERVVQIFRHGPRIRAIGPCYSRQRMMVRKMADRSRRG